MHQTITFKYFFSGESDLPAPGDHAERVEVAVVCGPERRRHTVFVRAVAVLSRRLAQQIEVAIPRRLVK